MTNIDKEQKDMKDKGNINIQMEEKVHFEIKFTETADGYRLEAIGDKEALRKLGISPNMLNRKMGRSGPRGPRREPHGRRRRAAMAKRRHRMNHGCRQGLGPRARHLAYWTGHNRGRDIGANPQWAVASNETRNW